MAINTTIPNVIEGEIRKLPLNQNFDWTLNNIVDLQSQVSANDIDIANRYTKAEVDALDANLQSQVTTNKNTMDNHIASTTAHDANNIVLTSEDPYLTANNVESGLEQVSARVSTIIAQSGTSSTEVVDARTSSTYGVFTTLGNRLNASDIKLKAVEDEIYTQTVGTLSLTPTTSNQSPTDSYSGVVDVEIGGATIANIFDKTKSFSVNGNSPTELNDVFTVTTTGNTAGSVYMIASDFVTGFNATVVGQKFQTVTTPSNLAGLDLIIGLAGNIQNSQRRYPMINFLKPSTVYTFYLNVRTLSLNNATFDLAIFEGDKTADCPRINVPLALGLKSTEKVEINTSGVNINSSELELGIYDQVGAKIAFAGYVRSKDKIVAKPSTVYTFSNRTVTDFYVCEWDMNNNFITRQAKGGIKTFTTSANTRFIALLFDNTSTENDIMLAESASPKPYQPYKPSQLTVNCTNRAKFELSKLPNGVQNEILQMYGYIWAIKRNSPTILISGMITGMFTSDSALDWAIIQLPSDAVVADNNTLIPNSPWVSSASRNTVTSIGKNAHYSVGARQIMYGVVKGTSLATAQTSLVGTEIIYQLAQPIFIPYEDFPIYGIECEGLLLSHDDYTNVNYTGDLFPDVSLEYPRNLGASIDGLTQSMGNIYDIVTQTEIDLQTKKQNNLIINGGFDIWQRGITQTSSGYGSDDRWFNQNIGSTKTHSQQVFTIGQADVPNNPVYFSRTVVSSVAGVGNTCAKWQVVEDVKKLSGKVVSLSFYAKADASRKIAIEFSQIFGVSPDLNSIGVTTIQLTTTWQKFTVTANLPSVIGKSIGTSSSTAILFWFDAGSNYNSRTNSLGQQSGTFDIANVCLVEGGNPQDYQKESIGDVKKQCERYLFDLSGSYRMGYYQTNYIGFSIPSLLTKMRTIPVIYNVGEVEGVDYAVYTTNLVSQTGFTLSVPASNEIRATKTSHGLNDSMLVITSKIFADAEL